MSADGRGAPRLGYEYRVGIVFLLGLFMELLDMTVVNIAIPTLQAEFDAELAGMEWVVTGYLLSLAVFIPVAGFLADRFGSKRVFLFALTLFTVASLGAGAAWSIESLIGFRVLQGIGGGMLTPVGTAMVFRAFPRHRRAVASAFVAVPAAVAPAAGPILGAYLVEYQSWHWIFLLNVPIGLLGLALGWRWLREERVHPGNRFDVLGFVLSAGGFALLLFGLSGAASHDWTDPAVAGPMLGGLALLALLAVVERRVAEPMLDLRLLAIRSFRSANLVLAFALASMMGGLFLIPLFLQGPGGETVLETGFVTFAQAIGILLGMPLAAKLHPRLGSRTLIVVGVALVLVSSWLFTGITAQTDATTLRAWMVLRGFGMALTFVAGQLALFHDVPHQGTARASSLFNVSRQVAASIGVALSATVLAIGLPAAAPPSATGTAIPASALAVQVAAFQDAFWVTVVLAGIGLLAAILVPGGRPVHHESMADVLAAAEAADIDDVDAGRQEPAAGRLDPPRPSAAGLAITRDTKISDILREYGDIADVMEELGIRRVPGYSFRAFLGRAITVERAARIHRVPAEELVTTLRAAVERGTME
jgi:EmrB/QacA subfamily drug resistance transporter